MGSSAGLIDFIQLASALLDSTRRPPCYCSPIEPHSTLSQPHHWGSHIGTLPYSSLRLLPSFFPLPDGSGPSLRPILLYIFFDLLVTCHCHCLVTTLSQFPNLPWLQRQSTTHFHFPPDFHVFHFKFRLSPLPSRPCTSLTCPSPASFNGTL